YVWATARLPSRHADVVIRVTSAISQSSRAVAHTYSAMPPPPNGWSAFETRAIRGVVTSGTATEATAAGGPGGARATLRRDRDSPREHTPLPGGGSWPAGFPHRTRTRRSRTPDGPLRPEPLALARRPAARPGQSRLRRGRRRRPRPRRGGGGRRGRLPDGRQQHPCQLGVDGPRGARGLRRPGGDGPRRARPRRRAPGGRGLVGGNRLRTGLGAPHARGPPHPPALPPRHALAGRRGLRRALRAPVRQGVGAPALLK